MRKQITSIHKRKNKQTGATVSIFLVNLLKSAGGYLICEAFGVLNPGTKKHGKLAKRQSNPLKHFVPCINCEMSGQPPLLIHYIIKGLNDVMHYIAYLSYTGLSASTILTYISGHF
jgi:hypothetical protein